MQEKPFREIYSRDVISKAEISSRTFYHYYSNKNEVLDDTENELISGLKKVMEEDRKGIKSLDHLATNEEVIHNFVENFKKTIDYCIANKQMILTLLSENGDIVFLKRLYEITENEIIARTKQAYGPNRRIKQNHKLTFSIALKNYVSSVVNIISHLLQYGDNLSPREMRIIIGKTQVNSPIDLMREQFE